MDQRLLITMSGVATLAILAIIGKSGVMLVSAGAIGITVYLFRRARMRDRVIGIIAAGLGGSIGAEIVRTLYHYASAAGPQAGDGGSFMSALMVGLINAAAVVALVWCAEAWLTYIGRKSE